MTEALTAAPRLPWQFAAAERKGHFRAAVLVLPLLLFVIVTFATPVVLLLTRAVYDPSIANTLPQTVAALQNWDGKDVPDEAAYAALAQDFKKVAEDNTAAFVGKRMNYEYRASAARSSAPSTSPRNSPARLTRSSSSPATRCGATG
jgi:putative spermidine/putrescine transport system permease protein